MTVASRRGRPRSSRYAECVFVEDLLRTRSMCARRFNWSQMLAVVQLGTSLHKRKLLNRAQFAGDKTWQVETRITRIGRLRSLPTDKWLRRPDRAARLPPAPAAAPGSRLQPHG